MGLLRVPGTIAPITGQPNYLHQQHGDLSQKHERLVQESSSSSEAPSKKKAEENGDSRHASSPSKPLSEAEQRDLKEMRETVIPRKDQEIARLQEVITGQKAKIEVYASLNRKCCIPTRGFQQKSEL